MTFAQSFANQSSDLKINVMVVDDDPVFLGVISRMLEKPKFRDPSSIEITVIAVKDPIEALSTLKTQRHNIDLIVTDYYMPRINGLQLKKQITQEFGDIPVIVMSSDSNKEQESLACGAMCFLPKPIDPTDLHKIYQVALTCKRNDKSTLWTEHNHRDTYLSIPQPIQLLPEQADVLKSKKKRFSPRSDSRPMNTSNGNYVSTDGSGKHQKRKSNDGSGDDSRPFKKPKIKWSDSLHDLFLQAIRNIGLDKAVPKKILEFMNLQYLTRENVASHLQKYRIFLRKVAEQGFSCSRMLHSRGIESIFLHAHLRDPYNNNNYAPSSSLYDKSINNRSLYSKPGQGYGQSRLLSNTADPVRFNHMPYNYMNRSSTYEPRGIGSNLTTTSNINFPTQLSPNEGRRSLFEPTVMANKTGQTSQVVGFGQHGLSDINGHSFNSNLMNNYGILAPNQPGMSSYGNPTSNQPSMSNHRSLTPTQPGMSSYSISTTDQPGMNSHGSVTPDKHGMSSYISSTSNQPGMSSHASLSPNQPGLNSYGNVTHNASVSSYENLTPGQLGPSQFSNGWQLFLNNENTAYKPQPHANANTQANLEIPQLENISVYDYLGNTDELPCDISNFQFDHNKQQEEAVSTNKFELPADFETELNQIFSLEENGDRNIKQGRSDGEISDTFAAPEMNSPIFSLNPNHDQEQHVPDLVDWSSLDPKDLANEYDDFMDSLFTSDMN